MKYFTLVASFLLLNSMSYGQFDPSDLSKAFPYRLSLKVASAPEVKDISDCLIDLKTEQLTLQVIEKDDWGHFDEMAEDLALFTCAERAKDAFQWGIKHKESGEFIGLVGFHKIDKKHGSATLSLYLEPDYRVFDFMAEVMGSVLDFGYDSVGLNRIDFFVYRDKIGFTEISKLCDFFGFTKVGELPQFIYHSGCYHNYWLYCLLQKNFKKSLNS